MRKYMLSGAALVMVTMLLVSFTTEKAPIVLDQAGIVWTGKKLTGSHTGTLEFSEMNIDIVNDALVGASFVVDMTSIKNTDLDDETAKKLVGHLSSDDFFGIKKYPTAKFISTNVKLVKDYVYEITGDMTIKGVTNSETFKASVRTKGATYQANADIMIDRSKYNVKYGSGSFFENLGDKAINDEFNLVVQIEKHNH